MHVQGNSFQSIEIVNTKFDMDLLEKVRHLIEEESTVHWQSLANVP